MLIPSSLAADFSGVQAGTGCGPVGTMVSIHVSLEGIQDPIGNMDLTIAYDPTPVIAFFAANDSGALKIEGVGG